MSKLRDMESELSHGERVLMAIACLILLATMAIAAAIDRPQADDLDCLARGKSPSCQTEVYGE